MSEKLAKLFNRFDVDKSGKVDIDDARWVIEEYLGSESHKRIAISIGCFLLGTLIGKFVL